MAAYVAISWLAWVPNLMVAELYLNWSRARSQLARADRPAVP
jgi:hypothetical protein